jgi:hypothetical protein
VRKFVDVSEEITATIFSVEDYATRKKIRVRQKKMEGAGKDIDPWSIYS